MTFQKLSFLDVFNDESGGNIKTPQKEYKEEGLYAVVDQGKALIAGYVDDPTRLCGSGRPAIVFGDHTRCIKYVNFPFCMGADGVKVLRPKIDADLNYLYHFLRQVNLPDAGYDRHFKYLKRIEIVLPPLPEQRRIAAILDQADQLRVKRREALAELDRLTQSIFVEMFGDPISNPKNWKNCLLEQVTHKITDGTHKTPVYTTSGIEFLSAKDIKNERIVWNTEKYISEEEHSQLTKRCNPEIGDIVLAKSGSLGSVAVIDRSHQFSLFESLCLIKHDRKQIDALFLTCMLRNPSMLAHLLGKNKGIAIKHLHLVDIRGLQILLPPISLQHEFANRIGVMDKLKSIQLSSFESLNFLFTSLQHRAFRGEL